MPDNLDKPNDKLIDFTSALLCRVCGKHIPIELARTDGDGKAVHEECYAQKLQLENASIVAGDGTATRPWRVVADEVSREQDQPKPGELVSELDQALDEIGKPTGRPAKPDGNYAACPSSPERAAHSTKSGNT